MFKSVWARNGARRIRRRGFDANGVVIETPKASSRMDCGEEGLSLPIGGGVTNVFFWNFSFEMACFGAS